MAGRKALDKKTVNERAQHFLKVLIERYIRDGEPIGSRTLARDSGLHLSPATIRNVLADLEELGLIISPHTSAGRVPTVPGYRMFVDSLITLKPLEIDEVARIERNFTAESESKTLVETTSKLLSGLTRMAGIVMVPRRETIHFRQIEFLPLSGRQVLTILVTSEGEVHNCIINTRRNYTEAELIQSANLLSENYAGQGLEEMRRSLLKDLQETRDSMNRLMARALEMAEQVIDTAKEKNDFILAGQTNLMDFNELANMESLRRLFDSFTEKHELLHLLDESMRAEGVQLFIGEETGKGPLDQCSLVTAPYEVNDNVMGVLGVIGPTRMAYDRVIPIVDITAKLLGAALKQR